MPSPLPRWVRWADRSWLGLFHPVASSPSDIGLPHMSDGSAPTSSFFEACSAFTHVTACLLATSPSDVFSRRLRRFCHLHRRSDSYRLERPSCRMGIAPIEEPNLSRRTDMHCLAVRRRARPRCPAIIAPAGEVHQPTRGRGGRCSSNHLIPGPIVSASPTGSAPEAGRCPSGPPAPGGGCSGWHCSLRPRPGGRPWRCTR